MGGLKLIGCAAALGMLGILPAKAQTKPGLYESTVTMSIPGAPAQPPQTSTMCVTADEAKDPSANLLKSMQENQQCKVVKQQASAGRFVADLACTGEQQGTMHLDFTFSDTGLQGTTAMTIKPADQPPMTMTMAMRSVRKGDCK